MSWREQQAAVLAVYTKAHASAAKEDAHEPTRHALEMADFVRFPPGVLGTACINCQFTDGVKQDDRDGTCQFHGELPSGVYVDLRGKKVYHDTCCAAWDVEGVTRPWQTSEDGKTWRDQPRAPAGGPHGGEWTAGGASGQRLQAPERGIRIGDRFYQAGEEIPEEAFSGRPGLRQMIAHQQPKPASEEKPVPTETSVADAAGAARDIVAANKRDRTGLTPLLPALYDAIKEKHPGLTEAQFHAALQQLQKEGEATLQTVNDPRLVTGNGPGLYPVERYPRGGRHGGQMLGWVQFRPGAEAALARILSQSHADSKSYDWRSQQKAILDHYGKHWGDWRHSRDEEEVETAELMADILGGLFGDDVLEAFADDHAGHGQKLWDESLHPRGRDGRFIVKGSATAVAAAKQGVDEIRKLGESGRTPEHARQLAEHLSNLTVKQLHELKKEYGLKASGRVREQLVAKLLDRLPGAQERIDKERKAAAKQLGLPAEATMRDVVEHLAVEAGYPEHFISKQELEEKLDELGVSVPVQRGEAVRAAFEVLREGVRAKPDSRHNETPTPDIAEPESRHNEEKPELEPKPKPEPSAGKPRIEPAGKVSIEWDGTVVPDENGKYNGYRVGDQLFASRAAAQRHIAEQQQQAQQAAETQAEDTRREEDRKRAREEAVREHEARQERIATVSAVATDRVKEELRAAGMGDIARRTKPRLGGIDLPKNAPEEAQQIRDRVIAELSDLATRSIREKLTPDQIREEAAKLRTPKPPEPGFTGTDSLGRRWEDGKLVAKT